MRVGRLDATEADPEGLIPNLETATGPELRACSNDGQRTERAPLSASICMKTRRKVLKLSPKTPRARDYSVYLKHKEYWVRERRDQRLRSSRTSSKSRTMPSSAKKPWKSPPAVFDPPYVDYAFIQGGGEIPRVGAYPARPNAPKKVALCSL